jgi:predicted esterase
MQEISWYTSACRLGREGRLGEALSTLRAGLDEGSWYNPGALASEPDLAAARQELEPIIRECEERRQRLAAETRPQCLVLSPSSALWDQQTLLLLHSRGDSARQFAERWRPLVDEGWTLVVPQSSQPWDSAGWCWDDSDLAHREIRTHLEECRTRRGLDPARIVVAGASQGAPLAAETANEAGLPWLCVIPSFAPAYDVTGLVAVPRHTRGVFLLGENDPANTRTRLVIAALASAGASIQTRTMAGTGHELPEDFAVYASEALKSVYG